MELYKSHLSIVLGLKRPTFGCAAVIKISIQIFASREGRFDIFNIKRIRSVEWKLFRCWFLFFGSKFNFSLYFYVKMLVNDLENRSFCSFSQLHSVADFDFTADRPAIRIFRRQPAYRPNFRIGENLQRMIMYKYDRSDYKIRCYTSTILLKSLKIISIR